MQDCSQFGNYIVGIFSGAHSEWVYYFWAIVILVVVIIFHEPIKVVLDFLLKFLKKLILWIVGFFKKISGKNKKR